MCNEFCNGLCDGGCGSSPSHDREFYIRTWKPIRDKNGELRIVETTEED